MLSIQFDCHLGYAGGSETVIRIEAKSVLKLISRLELNALGLYREYERGAIGAEDVICELDRLVGEREKLMSFVECAKLEHTRPTYLRDMSVVRQYLIDLRDYFCRELKAGNKPKFDVTNLDYAMSERFSFLR